ncbi:PLP-dependent aminotransferase family protein [Kitasatospora aureofaciens]|uniref:MocR-like pyridoxine biosynthesis transcription factor PdxR n=1 Tax=Kitasatospora aureofaciens TaxID=1894 RepID=UPI001C487FAD|nr:PLP-dependent aminotransferase family protein [Kitasatospora aureofaciens]MBV6702469.1 PLP-dependent aminotransferase family protein [Kitasatospora aureofaciens]
MNRSKGAAPDRSKNADPGADFLQLDTADAPPGGLTDWLARRLREAVADGRLPAGSRLPATRVLAGELGVSRGVVTDAYRRLTEEGQVAGRGRGGTVVVAAPVPPVPAPPAACPAPPLFRDDPGPEVFDALRAAPARIDLSPGVPDLAAFPRAAWLRAERAVLDGLSAHDLGYGDPRGALPLRQAVAHWLARNRGIRADPDDVLITAGIAQALTLLGQALGRAAITEVAVEDPGSLGARQHLAHWLAATPPVPVDADGIRVDALRATGAPAVLLTPAHQYPTGVVLGGERRRELLRWAGEGGLVIEDDYDAEHRYDRPPVPALRAALPERVCYTGSISKLLAPALRTGWLLVPPRYREDVLAAKRFADLGNPVLPQLVIARVLDSGVLERHLRLVRRRHRRRRDAMIAAVRTHLPGAEVHGAAAGLHLMLTLPPGLGCTDTELATAALAHGVKVQPLSWHARLPYPPGLVLGYAAGTPGEIAEGIAVLGRLARQLG